MTLLPPPLPLPLTLFLLVRRFEVLWSIFGASLRFRKIMRRRNTLIQRLEAARQLLVEAHEQDRAAFERLEEAIGVRGGGLGF